MREELDTRLVKKYPKIFVDRYKGMLETCMYWGFECGDGWYWLIDNLCQSIQSYIDSNSYKTTIKNKITRKLYKFIRKLTLSSKYKPWKYNLYNWIWKVAKKEKIESIGQVVATQVKEKFGGLRFYYNGGDQLIDGMIRLAEHESYYICEECGSTEHVGITKEGWLFVRCKNCAEKLNLIGWKEYGENDNESEV
jgi:hypothetical protein